MADHNGFAHSERLHVLTAAAVTPGMVEPHDCDRCGDTYDEASGDGYAGLCPRCADDEDQADDDDLAEAWVCPYCPDWRTEGMSLADRDLYDAHLAGHRRERAVRAANRAIAGR